ncbi:MAG TPA: filamentous hemagglutinin N-terminal domain-containing protein [Burkholderiales bacterium]|nr:filamentous hemagglutinin N-terminal domain-containing protein [Burkholderiales bacterium]
MNRAAPGTLLKPKLLALSVAACFALNAAALRANPTGPTVVHGGVGFNGLGTSALTITNQAGGNAIIHWNGFSIGVNELTRFQQFANLAVLNRVTGSEISSILGSLQSDGRVFLINPNGIVFGASARIDTAGLVASSLGLSDRDFLANRLRFTEVPGAGAVVNNGVIETTSGGRVYLVAPTVENNGLIHSPQGAIVLAAGKEVELVDASSPFVTVKVASAGQAVNLGTLVTDGGQIGMFGALVRNAGVIEAGGAVAGPGGEIRLVAAKDLTLDAGSVVSANGTSGGKVLLQAEGGTNLVAGTVEAKGSSGSGGTIDALGVRVGVVGHGLIDASGDTGGGTVRVGGDYQGANAQVQNAERTYFGSGTVIRADATTAGDGGRVIVWADGDTRFYGEISARGGSESGNGGFVETSAKEVLQVSGTVSTAAPSGTGGVWLLDPRDIKIQDTGGGTDDNFLVANGTIPFEGEFGVIGATSTIWVGSIDSALANVLNEGSVVLQATRDILLETDISLSNAGNLTLQAGDDIAMGAFNISVNGSLTMIANDAAGDLAGSVDPNGIAGSITSTAGGGNITTNGGSVTVSGVGVSLGNVNALGGGPGGGDVSITATGSNIVTGSITTNTAGVSLFAQAGAISVNGTIDTRGADGFNVGNGSNGSVFSGRSGGDVTLSSDGATTVSGSILTGGGNGLDSPDSNSANDRIGGDGGDIAVNVGGDFSVVGTIDATGGSGGTAGNAAAAANGGNGGSIDVSVNGAVDIGSIVSRGGHAGTGSEAANAGGTGGLIRVVAGDAITVGAVEGSGGNGGPGVGAGGDGGHGASVTFSSPSLVTIATVDVTGGNGGAGGESATDASGGAGGNGGSANVYGGQIVVGTILAQGGDGSDGGTLSNAAGFSNGGAGGGGGFVRLDTTQQQQLSLVRSDQLFLVDQALVVESPSSTSGGPIVAGRINVSGGDGGASGPIGAASATGGSGGAGGDAVLVGSTIDVAGPILAGGGDGGASVNASLGGAGTPSGGNGGAGGEVWVYGLGTVQLNIGGTAGDVAIDVSGGAGGAGNPATSPAGDGGDGGEGGFVNIIATPDMWIFGSIDASGGAGGAGGAGTTSIPGGAGGLAGAGGVINLDASSTTGSKTGDGFIFVLASTQFNVDGGRGGAAGSLGGASATSGTSGTFEHNSDYFGTIIGLDPVLTDPLLTAPLVFDEVNSGLQQIVDGSEGTVAFVGGEKQDEEEDKSQKELASCKG